MATRSPATSVATSPALVVGPSRTRSPSAVTRARLPGGMTPSGGGTTGSGPASADGALEGAALPAADDTADAAADAGPDGAALAAVLAATEADGEAPLSWSPPPRRVAKASASATAARITTTMINGVRQPGGSSSPNGRACDRSVIQPSSGGAG